MFCATKCKQQYLVVVFSSSSSSTTTTTTTTTKDYYLQLVAQTFGACHLKNKEVMRILMILQICDGKEEDKTHFYGLGYA